MGAADTALAGCSPVANALAMGSPGTPDRWHLLASPGATVKLFHDPSRHTRVVRVVTGTAGAEARLVIERVPPVSLRNRILRFWVKIDEATAADVVFVYIKVGSGKHAFDNLGYQQILAPGGPSSASIAYLLSTIKPGEWTPVTLGPRILHWVIVLRRWRG